MQDDFFKDPEEEREQRRSAGELVQRCNPERLLAFVQKRVADSGSYPTLLECKKEFGGIIGVLIDYQTLIKSGRLTKRY